MWGNDLKEDVVPHQDSLFLIQEAFHQCGFPLGWSFNRVIFRQGGLLSGWSFIRVVSQQDGLYTGKCFISWSSVIRLESKQGGL